MLIKVQVDSQDGASQWARTAQRFAASHYDESGAKTQVAGRLEDGGLCTSVAWLLSFRGKLQLNSPKNSPIRDISGTC